jgi:hypothetical protein
MAFSGGWVGAAAAAQKRRRARLAAAAEEEEEMMAEYAQDELADDWEFKIVRSESRAFRRPEVLQALVEEEAQAGWVLLEKLDDGRVRFKRPRRAQTRDIYLPEGVDPYRTQYDTGSSQAALVVVMLGLLMAVGLGFAMMLMMSTPLPSASIMWTLVAGIVLVAMGLGFVAVAAAKRRR